VLVIKLKSEASINDTIRETVFVGVEGQTLQNAGSLLLRMGEWQMFGALMLIGAEQVRAHRAIQGLGPDVVVKVDDWGTT
jgi:hypothetical protein